MKQVLLKRVEGDDLGIFGQLSTGEFSCVTGELPWRNNQHDKSCIPVGTYKCTMAYSPKHGTKLYHVMDVPNRGNVEIHSGNWCGNTDLGYKSDVLGCIIVGSSIGILTPPEMKPQKAILGSTRALNAFMAYMNNEDFMLTIEQGDTK